MASDAALTPVCHTRCASLRVVEPAEVDVTDEQSDDEPDVTERVEDVARAAAALAARGGELAAATHQDDVRRGVRTAAALATASLALLTGFAFANVAAERALGSSLSGWRAPLVLAGVWLAIGLVAAVLVGRWEPWLRRLLHGTGDNREAVLAERQRAFDDAQSAMHGALEALAAATAATVQREIAAAVVPDSIADVGEGLTDLGDKALEMLDDGTDAIQDRTPGGVVVNRAFGIALVPGRIGVRAARTVISFRQSPHRDREDGSPQPAPGGVRSDEEGAAGSPTSRDTS